MNGPSVRRGCVSLAMVADAVRAFEEEILNSRYCGEADPTKLMALLKGWLAEHCSPHSAVAIKKHILKQCCLLLKPAKKEQFVFQLYPNNLTFIIINGIMLNLFCYM